MKSELPATTELSAEQHKKKSGALYAIGAYFMWGLFPLYWIPLNRVPAIEILAHRILWALVFMISLLWVSGKWSTFLKQLKELFHNLRNLFLVFAAALLISLNWFIYIWAVTNNHVVESSMGYYINPLVSIVLGILILKEKLTIPQVVAVVLAACGVLVQTVAFGQLPLIALTLAFSFGFYGLTKKLIKIDPSIELTFETLFVTPVALFYLVHVQISGTAAFANGSLLTTLLLIGTGVVTAVPLLFFAEGAQRISLTMIGFFQYITPTLSLLIGITVYKEAFTLVQLISFSFIWLALLVFSLSGLNFKKRVTSEGRAAQSGHQ
ncbi:EamA family transporter RarD [Sporolactobacillus pectinivorans]|uniref:EamA family transporter RarD n=1 Tax=Sporolactobacillus pectinivorans TaxID=1591408 RepID=UPI001EFC7DE0|nr:EamA family transporter RarD [Sporolactobacillus pectinivorans]